MSPRYISYASITGRPVYMQVEEKVAAQCQAASLENLLAACQADASTKNEELQASQDAGRMMNNTLPAHCTLRVYSLLLACRQSSGARPGRCAETH